MMQLMLSAFSLTPNVPQGKYLSGPDWEETRITAASRSLGATLERSTRALFPVSRHRGGVAAGGSTARTRKSRKTIRERNTIFGHPVVPHAEGAIGLDACDRPVGLTVPTRGGAVR